MTEEDKKIESQARERYLHVKECIDGAGWNIFINDYVKPVLDGWGDIRELPKDLTPEQKSLEIDARLNAISRLEEVVASFSGEVLQYEDNTPDKESVESFVERT